MQNLQVAIEVHVHNCIGLCLNLRDLNFVLMFSCFFFFACLSFFGYLPLILHKALRTAFSHALQCRRTLNSTTCKILVEVPKRFCLKTIYMKQTKRRKFKGNIHLHDSRVGKNIARCPRRKQYKLNCLCKG